ncbi:MAG: RNA polymerase sigma factor [Bacteroidetes bacterium]|nr:RNA polymerase sigma factor [Bacteroidota bacterium]
MNSPDKDIRFLKIISDHKKLIYKICYAYCKDPDDRKDLEQEIIIQIWRSLDKYDEKFKLSTWLYRISLNTAISFYRKAATEDKYREQYSKEIISLQEINPAENSSEKGNKDERIDFIYEFLEELDKVNKALLLLYLDCNTYKEISLILGISETNVATKISRLKTKLREKFKNN